MAYSHQTNLSPGGIPVNLFVYILFTAVGCPSLCIIDKSSNISSESNQSMFAFLNLSLMRLWPAKDQAPFGYVYSIDSRLGVVVKEEMESIRFFRSNFFHQRNELHNQSNPINEVVRVMRPDCILYGVGRPILHPLKADLTGQEPREHLTASTLASSA